MHYIFSRKKEKHVVPTYISVVGVCESLNPAVDIAVAMQLYADFDFRADSNFPRSLKSYSALLYVGWFCQANQKHQKKKK